MKLDEFTIGQVFQTKSLKLTKEDIIRFAGEFDPQYMHLDEEKANQGRFNGIIASGIHTLAISFKLWVDEGIYGDDVIAGTRMNNIKFISPSIRKMNCISLLKLLIRKQLKMKQVFLLYGYLPLMIKRKKFLRGNCPY